MNSFIDSGAGLVLSMVRFSPSIYLTLKNCEAYVMYNKLFTHVKRLIDKSLTR